jgi:hypothetical protein
MTKVTAALHDACRARRRPQWIDCGCEPVMLRIKPVGAPLPNIADDTVDAIVIRWIGSDGAGRGIAVLSRVRVWKGTLPDIAAVLPAGG